MIKNSDPALYQSFLTARECHRQGNLAGAEAIYSRLLALDPADDELLFLFGNLQASKGAVDLGLECLRLAGQLKPSNFQVPFSMGLVLQGAGRLPEAADAYRRATAINPGFLAAWENLCAACYDNEDYALGLEAARRALALDGASLLAIRGAANCCTALGRRGEALAVLERGIEEHPALPELRIHHAWELMANGDFAAGWRALEWRSSDPSATDVLPRLVPWPRWNGEPLTGKTILVYGEQGIGDEIMYAPFVRGIIQAGGRCILECDSRLEHLFAAAFPQCQLLLRDNLEQIAWRADLPTIDYCISALSLPVYFPPEREPFLFASSERVSYWRKRFQEAGAGLKVGISWRGGVDAKARKIRSIPVDIFGTLVDRSMTFVALQYGAAGNEVRSVSSDLLHFPEVDAVRDFDEFAAMVAALDVVVSVDNSTVHLAGALGVRTLVLLPVYSEWRWGSAPAGESPWYRTVEMMRQPQASAEGWHKVLEGARIWLSTRLPATAVEPEADLHHAVVLRPRPGARTALLVGDTQCMHHWGYAAASLGLHAGLRAHFDTIDVIPVGRFLKMPPLGLDAAGLDSDELFNRFESGCPDIIARIRMADCVIVDGGISAEAPASWLLLALYVGYVAVRRFGKRGLLLNATAPVSSDDPAWKTCHDQASRALEVVVRNTSSLAYYSALGASVNLGFDGLPRFQSYLGGACPTPRHQKLVLAGVGFGLPENISPVRLASWMHGEGYAVELLLGAKGPLASLEIESTEGLAKALSDAGVPFALRFYLSEREWCEAIASAALLVSGDFHHLLVAALQSVHFLMPVKGGVGQAGLLEDLGIEGKTVAMTGDPKADIEKARGLLSDGTAKISPAKRAELNARVEKNFAAL